MKRLPVMITAGLVPLIAGAVVALVLMVLPLPTLNELGGQAGWCGPGEKSDNAVQVLLNPDVVNQDPAGNVQTGPDAVAFRDFCSGEARDRLLEAGLAAFVGWLVGAGTVVVLLVATNPSRRAP